MALSQAQTQHGVQFFLGFFCQMFHIGVTFLKAMTIIGKILPAAEKLKELKEVM